MQAQQAMKWIHIQASMFYWNSVTEAMPLLKAGKTNP